MNTAELIQLICDHGFSDEQPHTCMHTGNPMRAFYAPNDEYRETAVYIDKKTGEVEVDIATSCSFLSRQDEACFDDEFKQALKEAQADIAAQ